jgi:hypothetical protein
MKFILYTGIAISLLVASCASVPQGSVTLADALQTEGARMHSLNLHLLNSVFKAKREALENLLSDQYAASLIDNVFKKNSAIQKEDFPELLKAITRKVISKRDSLVNVLETEKAKLQDALNTDYAAFNTASIALKLMLESAVKVTREKQALFDQVKSLSNSKIDFSRVENALDGFIQSAGTAGAGVTKFKTEIDQILKK